MKPSLYAAKMTPDCAICYVADTNFTLPTLVSATGLRKFVPPEMAPIYVFLIDDDGRISELSRFLAPYHIRIVSMSSSAYSNFDRDQLNRSHVPAAALVPLHRGLDGFKLNGGLGGPRARPESQCCARRPGSA